jgi:hypothetical protein
MLWLMIMALKQMSRTLLFMALVQHVLPPKVSNERRTR